MLRHTGNILTGLIQFTIALALMGSSPTRLKAQAAELWGTVKDGSTQQSLLADISIVHLESRQTSQSWIEELPGNHHRIWRFPVSLL